MEHPPGKPGSLPLPGFGNDRLLGGFAVPPERLDSDYVPQADDPDRVVRTLAILHGGQSVTPETLGVGPRNVDYYLHAVKLLGFVSKRGQLLKSGRAVLALDDAGRRARLALAFENSECGRAWTRWYRATGLHAVPPDTAQQFLGEFFKLSDDTSERRANTLKAWSRAWLPYHPALRRSAVPIGKRKPEALSHSAVLDSGKSADVVQKLGPGTALLRCATAYLSIHGYQILVDPLDEADLRLLVGAETTLASVKEILLEFRKSIETGVPTTSKGDAIRNLHRSLVVGRAKVRGFDPRRKPRLHAKVYLFDDYAIYVTSANLSRGGLRSNVECGYVVRAPEAIAYYIAEFDSLFERAEDLTIDVIKAIEESWVFEPLVQPYLFFLRALVEVFPNLPDLSAHTDRRLAEYQEPIVEGLLHILHTFRGSLLISPTGTGKTIMACYAAAALFEAKLIRRVIVICTNPRLKHMWEMEFDRVRLAAKVVTHGIVQGKGKPEEGVQKRLKRVLGEATATDLVIVDECHAFRNEETNGFENLQSCIGERGKPGTPRLLLLSATPMSRGIDDLNSLLGLIAEPPLNQVKDLEEAERVINVPLPFIVRKFGTDGRGGPGAGLRFGDELRYFGRIRIRTIKYRSPSERAFMHIAQMNLRFRRAPNHARPHEPLNDDLPLSPGFFRLTLMRRAESSPRALLSSIQRFLKDTETPLLAEALREERASLVELQGITERMPEDTKLTELAGLIRNRGAGRRVLIFSMWSTTVTYLLEKLKRECPGERIEALTGEHTTKARTRIIKRFAPIANGLPRRDRRNDIDILIATDAIGEGENLQDAEIVVNYDLPWTPLYLIQRVGRVDRPTRQLREIEVWNFFPDGDLFERQVNLWERLDERSDLYDQMARTRVLGEHDRDLGNIDAHDVGVVRAFYRAEADLDAVRERYLPTSTSLVDRAHASKADLERARALTVGFRSVKEGEVPGVFALVRTVDTVRCIFWPADGSGRQESPAPLDHELLLRHVKADRATALAPLPPGFNDRIGDLMAVWIGEQGLEEREVTLIGAEVIVPVSSPAQGTGKRLR